MTRSGLTAALPAIEVCAPSPNDDCNHSDAEVLGEHHGNRRHPRLKPSMRDRRGTGQGSQEVVCCNIAGRRRCDSGWNPATDPWLAGASVNRGRGNVGGTLLRRIGRSRQKVMNARKRPNLRENPEIRMVRWHARGWKIRKAGICIQNLRKTAGTEVGPVFFSGNPVEGGRDWDHSKLWGVQKRGQEPIAKWPEGCFALLVPAFRKGVRNQ
jgi:hypothetical protein